MHKKYLSVLLPLILLVIMSCSKKQLATNADIVGSWYIQANFVHAGLVTYNFNFKSDNTLDFGSTGFSPSQWSLSNNQLSWTYTRTATLDTLIYSYTGTISLSNGTIISGTGNSTEQDNGTMVDNCTSFKAFKN